MATKKRNEIADKYKWKLEDIFASDKDWEDAFSTAEKNVETFAKYKGKLGDRDTALAAFKAFNEIDKLIEAIYVYSNMRMHEDGAVALYVGMASRAGALVAKASAASAFVRSELSALDDSVLQTYIADPDFAEEDTALKNILRMKAHILTESEERMLALASDALNTPSDTFHMYDDVDIRFEPVEVDGKKQDLTMGSYSVFIHSDDRNVRKQTFENMYKTYGAVINTLAANYGGSVKGDNLFASVRKYKDCLEMGMFDDGAPESVYMNLLDGVSRHTPALHKYLQLRQKALGLDELHMYDMHVPIVKNAEIKVSYEKACETVKEGLKPMGKEYGKLLDRAFGEGWIDVFENEGKRTGAYSWSCYNAKHPYVLLNYTPTTNDLFTIAHELGHAMHYYNSAKSQPYSKWNHQIFVAEVASTCNETLLLNHLLKTSKDVNLKKYLLSYQIDMFRTTLFRQTQFAEFEYNAHKMNLEGKPLTAESLSDMYLELNKKYYGEKVCHDEPIRYEWARIPHFYTAFYVYKYATGLTSAINIADKILNEKGYCDKYIEKFLCAGGSKLPYEILCDADVDLATPAPFERAFAVFENAVAELEKLV